MGRIAIDSTFPHIPQLIHFLEPHHRKDENRGEYKDPQLPIGPHAVTLIRWQEALHHIRHQIANHHKIRCAHSKTSKVQNISFRQFFKSMYQT